MALRRPDHRVAVLLATYNGEAFLREQLDSLLAQSHGNWVLYWRDDGSTDATVEILEEFAAKAGQGRCIRVGAGTPRRGPAGSFFSLLDTVTHWLSDGDTVAFADQDDVWLPDKLARGAIALAGTPSCTPAVYCARQVLVDARLQRLGYSSPPNRWAGFPASLTQNVATGCTMMLNRAAAALVAASRPAIDTLHDWWCYLLVTAAGGRIVHDDEPVVLYRQHAGNLVGAPATMFRRAIAAARRGPGVFMTVLRHHVAALAAQPHLLSEQARADVEVLDRALRGPRRKRWRVLRTPGLYRQTWIETLVFRCWFLVG